ncbi:monovalent cation/H+ antiporter subunit D family protein [Halorubrum luteum]
MIGDAIDPLAVAIPEWFAGLVVLLPLFASVVPIVAGMRYGRIGWRVAVAVLSVTLVVAAALAVVVFVDGLVRYEIGGIPVPYGIELHADAFSVTIVALDSLLALGVLAYTRSAGPGSNAFYSCYLLLTGGIIGIAMAGDLFNLYVFLEIMAIASYALVAAANSRWSTYAAMKYLLIGTVGATLYLLGVTLVFAATGTLNMASASVRIAEVGYGDPLVTAAFVFLTTGLVIKIALFPVHTWLADAHASAPTAISAMLSGLVPAVAVYALSRVVFTVFSLEFLYANPWLWEGFVAVAVLSMLVGNVFAVLQRDVKLMLAYSTVSQFGLVVTGIAVANETAVFGAVLQVFGHGIIKGGLFVLAGMFAIRFDARTLEAYAGLAKRSPVMGLSFVLLALAMIGLPPTVGFVGKWYIALGALREGMWMVAFVVAVSTLLTVMYVVPFINRLYFHEPTDRHDTQPGVTRAMIAVVFLAALFGIGLGLVSAWFETALDPTIARLLG